jgi:hypothetical protein
MLNRVLCLEKLTFHHRMGLIRDGGMLSPVLLQRCGSLEQQTSVSHLN